MQKFEVINLESWSRRQHYEFFKSFEDPIYGMTVKIDITDFYQYHKANKTLAAALTHAIATAANSTDVFLYRERDGQIVKWKIVNPSITVATPDNLFNFCSIPFTKDFETFLPNFMKNVAEARVRSSMFDPAEKDHEVFYMTVAPWLHFDSMIHPNPRNPPDTVPRFAWGECKADANGRVLLPLNVQVNHCFIDAVHIAEFYKAAESCLKIN